MDRMGHDSERAAMIYLHGSAKRRQAIADTLSQLASEELKRGRKRNAARPRGSRSGTEAPRGFLTVEGRPGEIGTGSCCLNDLARARSECPQGHSRVHGSLSAPAPMLGPDSNPMGVTSDSASRTF
jgi:hypothetical protein